MPESFGKEHDFIRNLFMDLNREVKESRKCNEDKLDKMEERWSVEFKELKDSVDQKFFHHDSKLEKHGQEIAKHDSHFSLIKILLTTGLAGAMGFISWVFSLTSLGK